MDQANIVALLDAHDKVPTKEEAVNFKKMEFACEHFGVLCACTVGAQGL